MILNIPAAATYQDVHINKLKWKTITGNEIWSSPIVGS